jgi:recombination protein RecR
MHTPASLERLIQEFAQLPGIGKKTARRLAYFLLAQPRERMDQMAESIVQARLRIVSCQRCYSFAEAQLCPLCASARRDASRLCVVEKASDIVPFEAAGVFQGLYHVLGGVLSPLDGVGPEALHIPELVRRVREENVQEVVLALGSSPEADSTALLIDRLLEGGPARRTRLARGIPMGSDLEFVDEVTMLRAFEGRVSL